jgi:predicted RNA-binding Zn ribbon-like protein
MDSLQNILNKFDFGAGVLCLDFANTANWHASSSPEEQLEDYNELVLWGQVAGILSAKQAGRLLEMASQSPDRAQTSYELAIALREAIYHIFSTRSEGRMAAQADIDLFNRSLQAAFSHTALAQTFDGFSWEWEEQPGALDRMLWPVIRSAVDLMTSADGQRVGHCQDDRGCGFLFLDTSRNRSRRWCSMESCGNRAKAQRHYGRTRKIGEE